MPPSIPNARHLPGYPATVFESTEQKRARLSPWAHRPNWTMQHTSWGRWERGWSERYKPFTQRQWSNNDWTVDPAAVHRSPQSVGIQNTTSAAVQAVRANNDAQTVCGWSFGLTCSRSRLRKTSGNHVTIESLSDVAWQLICKDCLPQERAAAAALDRHQEPLSGDECDMSE